MKIHKLARNEIVGGAVLAALSAILMFFTFPIIPGFTFLKLDVSDVVVVIAFLVYGMSTGVLVALCKILIHFLITGAGLAGLIGDLSSLLSTLAFTVPLAWLLNKGQKQIIAYILGILSLTIVLALANYWVLMPLYMKVLNFNIGMPLTKYVIIGVIPFNLVKGTINSFLIFLLSKRLR
ncbi:ECF transporter S component [Bombilactobacillus thymidiniphilus]|uniref:Riboflavin transporter n=1 Tax=Bombilactobacillus thymidiniphilus TaxID=2923363 RepID=A0ABY4PDZ2_9LACO|nr:ECF transporter S component [Bombilactobacillus thymidiniphilus]UQS83721.1 ECF transporter S component [Bombilactobacillus thymidiniphilus]